MSILFDTMIISILMKRYTKSIYLLYVEEVDSIYLE